MMYSRQALRRFLAVLLLLVVASGILPETALADGHPRGFEIVHDPDADADCIQYVEEGYLLSGMEHTFRAVMLDEYKDTCSPADVVWTVERKRIVQETDSDYETAKDLTDNELKETVISGEKGKTLTFMIPDTEFSYSYQITALYSKDKEYLSSAPKSYRTCQAFFYRPDSSPYEKKNIKGKTYDADSLGYKKWIIKGKTWDLSREKVKMLAAANLSKGGEPVSLGSCAQSLKPEEEGYLSSNGLSVTGTAATGGHFIFLGLQFGSSGIDRTNAYHHCAVVDKSLPEGTVPYIEETNYYYYTSSQDGMLYLESIKAADSKGSVNIRCTDEYDQTVVFDQSAFRKISGDSSKKERLGQVAVSANQMLVFRVSFDAEDSQLIVHTTKPDWWDANWGAKGDINKKISGATEEQTSSDTTKDKDTAQKVKKPSKVSGFKVKAGKKKATLTWKAPGKKETVTGFQISYKKAGDKKWTVKKVKASKKKLVLKKLKKGKKYTIRIRKYLVTKDPSTSKKTTLYGKYTKKTVKIR